MKARLRQTPAAVIEQTFAETDRRDPQHEKTWLVLVDGQEAQLREVEAAIACHRTHVVGIPGFVQVLESLWKAAYCFHADGTLEAETWVFAHAHAPYSRVKLATWLPGCAAAPPAKASH